MSDHNDDFLFQSSDDDHEDEDDLEEEEEEERQYESFVQRGANVRELLDEFFDLRAQGLSVDEIAVYNLHCYRQVVFCAVPDDVIREYRPPTREHLQYPFEMDQACLELRSARPGSWLLRRSSQLRQIDIDNPALRAARARVLRQQKVELYAFSYVVKANEIRHQRFAFAPGLGWTLYRHIDIDVGDPPRVVFVREQGWQRSFGLFLDAYLARHAYAVWERRVSCYSPFA